jgi:tRNA(Arg) A34 adenosine deaminase TadA
MAEAIELAVRNVRDGGGGPFAALVVRHGEVIARGANRVVASHDPTAHAEVVAIREACRVLGTHQLEGCEVYATCEPCPMCLGAIYWARPDRLYYAATKDDAARAGFDDAFIYEEAARRDADRRLVTRRLDVEAARLPFEEWARSTAKVPY